MAKTKRITRDTKVRRAIAKASKEQRERRKERVYKRDHSKSITTEG